MLLYKIRQKTPAKKKILCDRNLYQIVFKEWNRLCRIITIKKVASYTVSSR